MTEVGDIETRNGKDYRYNGARWVPVATPTFDYDPDEHYAPIKLVPVETEFEDW